LLPGFLSLATRGQQSGSLLVAGRGLPLLPGSLFVAIRGL